MARFYGDIQGNRGQATRMGTRSSGIEGHIRGWDVGVSVRCYVDEQDRDICEIRETGGSSGSKSSKLIAKVGERMNVERN